MYKVPGHSRKILQKMNEFRSDNSYCDVAFIIDGIIFNAHKSVLAASSRYFHLLFSDNFRDSKNSEIPIHGIESEAFSQIIDFIYTSQIQLTEETVFGIIEAADLLQIHALRPYIYNFLMFSLNIRNCVSIYATALFRGYVDLANTALRYSVENFSSVIEDNEFLDIPADIWERIFNSDVLNCEESILLKGLIEWFLHSPETRLTAVNHLSSYVDVSRATQESLRELLQYQNIGHTEIYTRIKIAIICYEDDFLNNKEDYRLLSEYYEDYKKRLEESKMAIRWKSLRCSTYNSIVLLCGGSASISPEILHCENEPWGFKLPRWGVFSPPDESQLVVPGNSNYEQSASAYNADEMYLLGGFSHELNITTNVVSKYSVTKNIWENGTQLPYACTNAAAAFCDGKLYLCGGVNASGESVNTLIVFQDKGPNSDAKWVELAPMNLRRGGHHLCSVNGLLFAVGGADIAVKLVHSSIEMYDPYTNEWTLVAHMSIPRVFFAASVLGKFIYVFGGLAVLDDRTAPIALNTSERYNTLKDEWEAQSTMLSSRSSCCSVVFKNRIYLCGGLDGVNSFKSVHQYNPVTRRWNISQQIFFDRYRPSAATLYMPENPLRKNDVHGFCSVNRLLRSAGLNEMTCLMTQLKRFQATLSNIPRCNVLNMEIENKLCNNSFQKRGFNVDIKSLLIIVKLKRRKKDINVTTDPTLNDFYLISKCF